MPIVVRRAGPDDAGAVVELIRILAAEGGEESILSEGYVRRYLTGPGASVLLAEMEGQIAGLLSFSIRPNLFHAADACLIEEFVVAPNARNQGAGAALMRAVLKSARDCGCAEISVSTMPDNLGAIRFYQRHGLTDESILLERHFI